VAGTVVGDFLPVAVWTAHSCVRAKAEIIPKPLF
jgi:hypothetical protein